MNDDRRDESFMARWSRQKRQAVTPHVEAPKQADAAPEDEPIDLAKLPNIDDLTAESDIAAFLRKGVPEALQRMALRKMWALDPSIRDFVEVAENQWDFNAVGGVPGLFQELAPDTDVSLWLTQASPSVLPAADAPISAVSSERSDTDRSGERSVGDPARSATADAHVPSPADDPPAPPTDEDTAMQQSDIAVASASPSAPLDPVSRRRHGGASPR